MKCANCGTDVQSGEKYCPNCGQSLIPGQKKSNNTLIVVLVVVGVMFLLGIVAVAGFSGLYFAGSKHIQSTVEENMQSNSANNNESTTQEEKTTTIESNGYRFTIPSYATASLSDQKILVTLHGGKSVLAIIVQSGTQYDTLLSMKDQIKSLLAAQEGAQNYDMSKAVTEEKTYNGMPFLVTRDISDGNFLLDIAYGKAGDNVLFIASVTNSDGSALSESERAEAYGIVASGTKIQ